MLRVDQLDQRLLKQVAHQWMFSIWHHRKPAEICKESSVEDLISGEYQRQEYVNVVEDRELITGENPASATAVGKALLARLSR